MSYWTFKSSTTRTIKKPLNDLWEAVKDAIFAINRPEIDPEMLFEALARIKKATNQIMAEVENQKYTVKGVVSYVTCDSDEGKPSPRAVIAIDDHGGTVAIHPSSNEEAGRLLGEKVRIIVEEDE